MATSALVESMKGPAEIAGFVLVGGNSRRMGHDKALLELHGKSLLLHAVELLQPYVGEVKLLGGRSRYSALGIPIVDDQYPGAGPMVGICSALKSSACDWNIILACDMPLVRAALLQTIALRIPNCAAQAIVPKVGNDWQPLCAAYHRSCLPLIEEAVATGKLAIMKLLPLLSVEAIQTEPGEQEMFHNINTIEDWQQIQSRGARNT